MVTFFHVFQASINIKFQTGATPLIIASENGHANVVKYLLTRRTDINAQNDFGNSALFGAARYGHGNVTELLINKGALVDIENENKTTPLMIASIRGHLYVVKVLVEKGGADVNAQDKDGDAPIHWAIYGNHMRIIRYLVMKRDTNYTVSVGFGNIIFHFNS